MTDERTERRDFRQEVTNNIIQLLERGTAPWQRPWDPEKATLEMPLNPTTGQPYRGGNALHLLAEGMKKGYEDPRWMTYRQAQENGWQVRKGEKGTAIEFWQFPSRQSGERESTETNEAEGRRSAPLHRIYTVFNAKQIDGVPEREAHVRPEWEVVQSAENILEGSGARVLHDQQNRAYYSRGMDEIHLPSKTAFPNQAAYYGTALHELVHWSGHESRLNRDTLVKSDGFGGPEYAKEELRAELGSLFLAAERGIPHDPEQHASYVAAWIDVLKKDKNEIFRAAKDASKATEYLLDRELDRQPTELEQAAESEKARQDQAEDLVPGHHRNGDGLEVPDILRTETSEHAATFDTRSGAVAIVEKNTATEGRELFQPVESRAPDARASGQMSREQILDGVVDGKPAPNGMPDMDRKSASLSAAKAVVQRELGESARTYEAHTDSGSYKGPIIGVTDEHLVQQITKQAAVIHEAHGPLAGLEADPNKTFAINYANHLATVQHVQPKSLTRELAELER